MLDDIKVATLDSTIIHFILLIFACLIVAPTASAQTWSECQCAELQLKVTDPVEIRSKAIQLTPEDVLKDPRSIAGLIRDLTVNSIAQTCQSEINQKLKPAITMGMGYMMASVELNERRSCELAAEHSFVASAYGTESARFAESYFSNRPSLARLLHQGLSGEATMGVSVGALGAAPGAELEADPVAQFLEDVLEAHFFLRVGEPTFDNAPGALLQLVPWAHPDWPEKTPLSQMTVSGYLKMLAPQRPALELVREFYPELAAETAKLPSYCAPSLSGRLQLDFDSVKPTETFDVGAITYDNTLHLLGIGGSPRENRSVAMLEAMGFNVGEDTHSCFNICEDPMLDFGQGCTADCIEEMSSRSGAEAPEAIDFTKHFTGTCDAMNAAYREACLSDLEYKRDREIDNCTPRFTISTPDHIDFSALNGISDCNKLHPNTRYNCQNYFNERGLFVSNQSQSMEALRYECSVKFCGALVDTAPASGDPDDAAGRKAEEEYARLRKESDETRRKIDEALKRVREQLKEDYTLRDGHGNSRDRRMSASLSHSLGGAIDVVLEGPGGRPATRKEYEALRSLVESEIANIPGVQTIIELPIGQYPSTVTDLTKLNIRGQERLTAIIGSEITPEMLQVGYDISKLPAETQSTIREARTRVNSTYFYDIENPSGEKSYTLPSGSPRGAHLHIGKPSYLLKTQLQQ